MMFCTPMFWRGSSTGPDNLLSTRSTWYSGFSDPANKERTASQKKQTTELNKAEKRKAELDHLFAKMYEDWAAGRITGRVSAQRLAALLRQVSKRSPPNRTYTSQCIQLSRNQSNFPACSKA